MISAPFFRSGIAAVAGLLAVAGPLAVAGLAAPAAAVDRGTVQGTFTTDSGVPIPDALVSVYSADYDWLRDGSTDASGRFRLANVTAGGVKLQFQSNGIQQWAHDAADFEGAAEFTLAANQTLTVDESRLPTGTITGVVTEPTGEPAWYSAVAHPVGGDFGTESYAYPDVDGRYTLDVLPGDYRVSFGRGATEQWAFQKADPAAATTFTVSAGQTIEASDTFLPTGSLGGRLTTADGDPLVEARVMLHRPFDPDVDTETRVADTYTDSNGDYTFDEVLPGTYRVSFTTEDWGPRQWLHGTVDPARAAVFTVVAGERTTADEAQIRTSTVRGKLVDSAGRPLDGYSVRIIQDAEDSIASYDATTGPDGGWSVDGVLPATYLVSFESPSSSRRQWAYGKGSARDAARFDIAQGSTVTVDDTWLPGATLVVTAVDAATGAPVSDFCGWLWSIDAGECTTGPELTVTDLPGGEHPLEITTGERSFYLGADERSVTLTPGQTTRVAVPLQQGGKAAITVTDAVTGRPVEDTCFALITPGTGGLGEGYGDCTNAAGKASTQAKRPGTYQVFAFGQNGYGHQWVGKTGGTGDQREAARVTIRAGKVTKAPTVLLDKAAIVTGTVTGDEGQPIPNAHVAFSAYGYGAGPANGTRTDQRGRYTLDLLGPYAWPLVFTTHDYPRQWSGGAGNRFQAEQIQLAAGASTTYDIGLKRGSSIRGVVSIASGAPGDRWRLNAFNAVTGDPAGMFDHSAAENGAYDMPLAGGQQIKIGWSLSGDEEGSWQDGWYDNATDLASATKVSVPKTGSKKLNLVLGRP
jgi:protocatechuate 3,4-dioxygenase beta subunit